MFLTLKLLFIFLISTMVLSAQQSDRIDNTKINQMEMSQKSSEDRIIDKEVLDRDMPNLNQMEKSRESNVDLKNRENVKREIPQINSPE